jgi:hypothetical protein
MSRTRVFTWAIVAMLAAGTTIGAEKEREAAVSERTAPGWIERGFARLERAIERLEARLAGRDRGAMTGGCEDMMAGGGMMGGPRPNERWRGQAERR